MKKLTSNQRKFADEYIKTGNATRSYLAAGYKVSDTVAGSNANRLLKNAKVKEYIDIKLKEISSSKIMDSVEVMERLTAMARGETPDFTVVTVKKADTITVEGEKKTYDKVVYNEEPKTVITPTHNSDKNKALELLGRRYSLFTDKVDLTQGDINITIGEYEEDGD